MTATVKFSMVPIKRTDIFQTVVQQLTNLLDSGQLHPGDRLPSERELSDALQVSRSSIRQGLKVLEASGRLETRVGSGTYVTYPKDDPEKDINSLLKNGVTLAFIKQLVVARTAIERAVFEEYSKIAKFDGIIQLRALIEENASDVADEDEGVALDLSFEAKVAELTQNIVLIRLQQQVHQMWTTAWRQYGFVPAEKKVLHEEHLQILAALAAKDTQRVVALIQGHIDKDVE